MTRQAPLLQPGHTYECEGETFEVLRVTECSAVCRSTKLVEKTVNGRTFLAHGPVFQISPRAIVKEIASER